MKDKKVTLESVLNLLAVICVTILGIFLFKFTLVVLVKHVPAIALGFTFFVGYTIAAMKDDWNPFRTKKKYFLATYTTEFEGENHSGIVWFTHDHFPPYEFVKQVVVPSQFGAGITKDDLSKTLVTNIREMKKIEFDHWGDSNWHYEIVSRKVRAPRKEIKST